MKMRKAMTDMIATIIIVVVLGAGVTIYEYTQRYVKNGMTATKGIVYTTTIDLSKYEKIGEGEGLFGKYDLVTRSFTQGKTQTLKIYE